MQAIAKMSSQGQVTIPREIREVLGLKPGDYIALDIIGRQLVAVEMIEKGNANSVPCQ